MTSTELEPTIPTGALAHRTAIVVGASRGLGRGIATTLAAAGGDVVALARGAGALADLVAADHSILPESGDASDPALAVRLLDHYDPDLVVVVAGAAPPILSLQEQTWETLSVNWNADVRIAFSWLQAVLRKPLCPGSRLVLFSSGAALQGSPLSGGYAGAKATQRFLVGYAQDEARRADMDLTFTVVMPRLTPRTELGRPAVLAYAKRAGQTEAEYMAQMGEPLTPEAAGSAVLELALARAETLAPAYLLTGAGFKPLS